MDGEKRRLVHSIEFVKDPYNVCEFIIALLSLNVSIEYIELPLDNHLKQRKTLKVYDQVEKKLG